MMTPTRNPQLERGKSTGSNVDYAALHEENGTKDRERGDVLGEFPSRVSQDSGHLGEQMQPFTCWLLDFPFQSFSSRIHKNAAGANGLKPPELHRVWQFIIQQAFSVTQFGFFSPSLLIIECLGQFVVSGYLLPLPKLYSQMHQYLLENHIHWQKKLCAFSENQVERSGTERWKYLDREAEESRYLS